MLRFLTKCVLAIEIKGICKTAQKSLRHVKLVDRVAMWSFYNNLAEKNGWLLKALTIVEESIAF